MDAINDALTPFKPVLRSITTSLPRPLDNFAISLLGDKCHASLLYRLDVSSGNAECFQLAISKALGTAIITAASIVKVPQIIKLVSSQSAAGLSLSSYLLETASFTVNLAYSFRSGFPFSTFGETAFIAIQDLAITILILVYSGRKEYAAAFVAVMAAVGYALFEPSLIGASSMKYIQAGASVLAIASKVPQIYTIWQEGGTGQLSAFAVFNYLAGSLSRIFTTIQEVDDPLILYGFVAGFIFNAILAAQMVYYWNSPAPKQVKPNVSHQKEKLAIGHSSGSNIGGSPSSATKSKAPSTRRRG